MGGKTERTGRKAGGMLSSAARSSPQSDADAGAHWRTPPALAEAIRVAFGLDPWATDLAATRESALAPEYYGPDHEDARRRDALALDPLQVASLWPGPVWCNPPYSRQGIDRWMKQCAFIARYAAAPVVGLVFARTDCAWFHDHAMPAAEQILFIRRRVAFVPPFTDMMEVGDHWGIDRGTWISVVNGGGGSCIADTVPNCKILADHYKVPLSAVLMLRKIVTGKSDSAGAPSMAVLWRHPQAVAGSPVVRGLEWAAP